MYKITLNDGTELNNLVLNGNNFISNTIIADSVFNENLATVTITDGEETKTYNDMYLVANRVVDNKSWFILAEKTAEMKREEMMDGFMSMLVDHEYRLTLSENGVL